MDLGRKHLDLALAALKAPTPADAWPFLLKAVLEYGPDTHIVFVYNIPILVVRQKPPEPEEFFYYKFPETWIADTRANPEAMQSDPFARHLLQSEDVICFDTGKPANITRNENEIDFVSKLRESGVQYGMFIPMHNKVEGSVSSLGVSLSFDSPHDEATLTENADNLRILATYFNEGLRLRGRLDTFGKSLLSTRERQCLAWASIGYTTSEVADELSLSDETVNAYIKKACKKLGAANRIQASTRAFLLSLMDD